MKVQPRSPKDEVLVGNPWYIDDQFTAQLGNPGIRHVIENRWHVFERFVKVWSEEAKTVCNHLKVLDAGCGDGINLFGLGQMLRRLGLEFDLYGCDYNPLRIHRAKNVEGTDGVFVNSLLSMSIIDGMFDIVFCNHVLEHIHDDLKALRELYRVLRPGGLLIAGVPNEGCAIARFRNNVFQPEIAKTTDHVQFYTTESFTDRLLEAGFRIVDLELEGFFMPKLNWNIWLQQRCIGRFVLNTLRKFSPGQAAGLIVSATL